MPVVLQVVLATALHVPFALLNGWDVVVTARLEARLAAIRAAGDPVTMVDLAKSYPDPPPGQNGADFYAVAFAKMDEREGQDQQLDDMLPIVGTAHLPDVEFAVPKPMLDAIRLYLTRNAETLELLRAATAFDECKFELDFTKGLGMLLPHLAKLRQAARLFALEAIDRTESGKPDEAAESLIACLRLGGAVRREPVLISTLVRIACDGIAVGQVERWASRARPSAKAIERLERELAGQAESRRKIIEQALVGERCFGMDIYQNYVLQPGREKLLAAMGEATGPLALLVRIIPKAYFKSDMICYIDIMSEYVAAARKPYPEGYLLGARIGNELERKIPRYYHVSRLILPALGRVFQAAQKHVAGCESARVGLAALRYKAQRGKLPETLQALAPDFIDAVPRDPFDGKPLRYRKDADGFTVYAVGENGKDDGGATVRVKGKSPDIGFCVRWPKAEF